MRRVRAARLAALAALVAAAGCQWIFDPGRVPYQGSGVDGGPAADGGLDGGPGADGGAGAVPPAPTALHAARDGWFAELRWSPPPDAGVAVLGYQVRAISEADELDADAGAATRIRLGGLTPGRVYRFAVSAVGSGGAGAEATVDLSVSRFDSDGGGVLPDGGLLYSVYQYSDAFLLADLDGDGAVDAWATQSTYPNLTRMKGNGDGTLNWLDTPGVPFDLAAADPLAGDFNGDGSQEVALSEDGERVAFCTRPLGPTDVNGSLCTGTPCALGGRIGGSATLHLPGGDLAAVAATPDDGGVSTLHLLHLNAQGACEELSSQPLELAASTITSADLDGDGADDLVLASASDLPDGGASPMDVWLGDGTGQFPRRASYAATDPKYVFAGQFSLSPRRDLLACGEYDCALYTQDPDAGFEFQRRFDIPPCHDPINAADVDGDGLTDLLLDNYDFSNEFGAGMGMIVALSEPDAGQAFLPLGYSDLHLLAKAADLDGDSKLDVVMLAGEAPAYLEIYRGVGP